ncbi:MAG: ATP-binding protein [Spirochaetes bacterium]|nr:ATP-binding protein [Spirochaetota bacterium]
MMQTRVSSLKSCFVLGLLVCLVLVFNSCFFFNRTVEKLPTAVWGVLDLRGVNFHSIETLPISGEFEFYWHSWEVKGDPVYIWGPRGWRTQFPNDFPFDFGYGGYGTYRLVILLPNQVGEIGLYLPPQHSAYSLWIDGQQVASNGKIGFSPDTYRGEWKPQVIRVSIRKPTVEIVLQISDYSMNTGGYFYPLRIGSPEIVEKRYQIRATSELLAFGVLMFVGLYCFIMYIIERRAQTLLFLGLSSFLFALRTITHGEMVYASFFVLGVEGINKIRYLTLFLLPVCVWGFFRHLHTFSTTSSDSGYTQELRQLRMLDFGIGFLSAGTILFTLVTPSRIFVPTLSIFPLYVGLLAIAVLYLLIRGILQHNVQGWILLVGFTILVTTVVRDLHIASDRLWDNSFYSPFGYVLFILTLAVVLGKRFSYLFEQQRLIAQERKEQAQYLESLVQERTRELQEMNSSLAQAVQAANAANEAKSKFLAMMSHEIRTPMNVVVGITELLERTPLNATQIEYVQTLRTAAEGLLVILNDVLDLSRLEAGTIRLEAIETNLAVLMQEVVGFFRPLVEKKGLYLRYSIDPKCPHEILIDPIRLKQVLTNLIGNAVKFTSCGGVDVSIQSKELLNQPGFMQLEFQVTDTGIGIPKDKIHSIFDSFVQADSSIARRFGGTGLGLTISKRLVDLMGGEIRVTSIEGKGSTFSFSIVAQTVAHPKHVSSFTSTEPDEAVISITPLRILMVEDNEMNRMVGEAMIQSLGWECIVASNGLEAINLLTNQPFDLVLMDIEMPEMDGIETAQRIRSGDAGQRNKGVPIVALSAHILPEIKQKTAAAGMNGYLTKPIRREKLYNMVLEIFPSVGGGGEKRQTTDKWSMETRLEEEVRWLLEKYNGNRAFIIGLYKSFAQDITNLLPRMEEALREFDFRILSEGARTLQNIAMLLERYDLSEPLSQLQSSSQQKDQESCVHIFQQVAPILLSYREHIDLMLIKNEKQLLSKG